MTPESPLPHRRTFLRNSILGTTALWTTPGLFAETLTETPSQAEGPFYPDKLPLDTDNDLIQIQDSITPAVGEITHLSGTVRSANGSPIRNALVEIWQADQEGNYIHTQSRGNGKLDPHFQGYGRFLTGGKGEYYFRCIKPTPYTRRAPHIHVAVSLGNQRVLTTQCYIRGHELNAKDFLLNRAPKNLRPLLQIPFEPLVGSKAGELTAQFDMVIGVTPQDP
jgi:protocatechuate 3,4-dioxygenase beta subunit